MTTNKALGWGVRANDSPRLGCSGKQPSKEMNGVGTALKDGRRRKTQGDDGHNEIELRSANSLSIQHGHSQGQQVSPIVFSISLWLTFPCIALRSPGVRLLP